MSTKQKEKSDQTRRELSDAMIKLFLEKGYEGTSIRDITDAAGYSVGSFYRHWKGKNEAFMELWDEYVSSFIRESVENAPLGSAGLEDMIDYLIMRSRAFADSELNTKLYATSRVLSALYEYKSLTVWAQKYTDMLCSFIRRTTGSREEDRIKSIANIMHAILDTHAMRNTGAISQQYDFDDESMRRALIALVKDLKNPIG